MGGGPAGRGGGWNLSRSMGRRTLSSRTGVSAVTPPASRRKTTYHPHHNNNLASRPLSLSKSTSAFVVSPNPTSRTVGGFLTHTCDHDTGYDGDWVCVNGVESEDLGGGNYFDDFALGDAPSKDEVESALLTLQKAFDPAYYPQIWDKQGLPLENQVSSALVHLVPRDGNEVDRTDFMDGSSQARALQNYGPERVFDAFDMLRNEPSVQKMVMSLSSDKAVWEAVLNNEVVKELRDSYKQETSVLETAEAIHCPAEMSDYSDKSTVEPNTVLNALRCFFDNTRVKVLQMIENISKIVGQMLHPVDEDGQAGSFDSFEEKLRASLLLSIFVLMVVAVARARQG